MLYRRNRPTSATISRFRKTSIPPDRLREDCRRRSSSTTRDETHRPTNSKGPAGPEAALEQRRSRTRRAPGCPPTPLPRSKATMAEHGLSLADLSAVAPGARDQAARTRRAAARSRPSTAIAATRAYLERPRAALADSGPRWPRAGSSRTSPSLALPSRRRPHGRDRPRELARLDCTRVIPSAFPARPARALIDIVDLVGRHVQLKEAGRRTQGACARSTAEDARASRSARRERIPCFGCGVHGNAVGFLMEYAGLSFPDAVRRLAQRNNMQCRDDASPYRNARRATQSGNARRP